MSIDVWKQQNETIESLRQQLAEKDAEIAQLHLARDMLYSEGCEKDAEIERLNNSMRNEFCYCVGQHSHKLGVCQTCKKPVAGWFDVAQQALKSFGAAQVEMYAKKERLAASQAREQKLRDALDHYQHGGSNYAKIAKEALAAPTDATALEAMIAKAGEVMRERCLSEIDPKYYSHELAKHIVEGCCNDLRALPGVTLEDLK